MIIPHARHGGIEPLEARIAPAAVLYMSADEDGNGLYQIDPATGAATRIGASGVSTATVGLTETANPYVLYGSKPVGLVKVTADGSGATVLGSQTIESLAMDLSTGILYAESFGQGLFIVDPETGAKLATLASPGQEVDGLAYDGNGHLFGLGTDGALQKYDIATNTWSTVGSTGIFFLDPGLAFDPDTGVLYAKGGAGLETLRD